MKKIGRIIKDEMLKLYIKDEMLCKSSDPQILRDKKFNLRGHYIIESSVEKHIHQIW